MIVRKKSLTPGIALASSLGVAAIVMVEMLVPVGRLSSVTVAMVLGLAVRSVTPTRFLPSLLLGCQSLSGQVVKVGVVLLGFRMNLGLIGEISMLALPLVVLVIGTSLIAATILTRLLSIPGKLGALIAVGTSICGVSAILSTAPAIAASEEDTSYAVASITIFGLLAMLVYPHFAGSYFGENHLAAGFFLGTAIHDTAQVVAAGLSYQEIFGSKLALDAATVTKLLRNCFLTVLIPASAWVFQANRGLQKRALHQLVPGFVVGFLALSAVRTLGEQAAVDQWLTFGSVNFWEAAISASEISSTFCFAVGLAALGYSMSPRRLVAIGLLPLGFAFLISSVVGVASVVALSFLKI